MYFFQLTSQHNITVVNNNNANYNYPGLGKPKVVVPMAVGGIDGPHRTAQSHLLTYLLTPSYSLPQPSSISMV